MSQVDAIRRLLAATPTPRSGRVVGFEATGAVRVATPTGVIYVSMATATKVAIGDTVALRHNAVVGKLKSDADIPHYVV